MATSPFPGALARLDHRYFPYFEISRHRPLKSYLYACFLDITMMNLAHMSGSLRRFRRAPSWTSLLDRSLSSGDRGILADPSVLHPESLRSKITSHRLALDTKIAAEELALAAIIHSELMSIRLPNVSYACLKGKTLPCRAIGGDFFDAIELPDALCAVVADVSGKGAPAAIVAAMLQGIIHSLMMADKPLTEIAGMVNEFLCSRATGKFATMVLLKVRANGTAEYVNCGHVSPVLANCTSARRLEASNLVVGLIAAAQYRSETCELRPGERILIFTDGITEAENSEGEQFGDSTLEGRTHLYTLESVFEHVSRFQGDLERSDDWTLFELHYRGGEPFVAGPS